MVETTVLAIEHIVKTPNVCGGAPRIANRRITVDFVVNYIDRLGGSAEEMVREFDLTPAQVYAALAYYYDHPAEIDALIEEAYRLSEGADTGWRQEAEARLKIMGKTVAPPLLTVVEIANEFNLDPSTVRDAIYKKRIEARKAGGVWLISRQDAEARWGNRAATKPTP